MVTGAGHAFGRLVGLTAGFLLWSLVLVLLYAGHGAGCATGQAGPSLSVWLWVILAAGLLAHIALAFMLARRLSWSRHSETINFINGLTIALTVLSAVATVWAAIPVFGLTPCL